MNRVNSINLYTDRLDLRIPTIEEQHRLWEILLDEKVNQYYFPTPDRIFIKNSLNKTNIDDLKKARTIFMEQLSDWDRQRPFYEKKIQSIKLQENSQKFTWSIFLKDSNTVIGQITCQPKEKESANIRNVGWYISPECQNKGYATEAAVAVLDFMFNVVEITAIKTGAVNINTSSWKIMEKLGFEYVGTKQSSYFKDNEILTLKEYHGTKKLFLNRKTIKK